MADKTKIQWTGSTWNPWQGCKKVSPGCKYCYMYRDKYRYGHDPEIVKRSSKATFEKPLKIKDPSKIFTCSWSDFFHPDADEWRAEAWEIIKNTPQHTYQILTKRPERILDHLPDDWGNGYDNVWLGVSAENSKYFKMRMQQFDIVPAKIKFVSAEPLIGEIDQETLTEWLTGSQHGQLDWIIIGGESGNNTGEYRYRECKIEWIKEIIDWQKSWGRSVFVKQLGTYLAKELGLKDRHGGDIDEWPEELKVREFPEVKK